MSMTDENLDAIISALPAEMNDQELTALTLTIYSVYSDDPVEVVTNLITAAYVYSRSKGISRETFASGLRMSAELYEEQREERLN